MENSSPARLYALLVGGVLTIAGIIGFFYSSSFDTGSELPTDEVLGILSVNGWHNIVHLATGLLGLAALPALELTRPRRWDSVADAGERLLEAVASR